MYLITLIFLEFTKRHESKKLRVLVYIETELDDHSFWLDQNT